MNQLNKPVFGNQNTPEYNKITQKRQTEYYIEQNIKNHPAVEADFLSEKAKKKDFKQPSFSGMFHKPNSVPMVKLEDLIISEDLAQRNPLAPDRRAKVIRIALNFDVRQCKPLQVDVIQYQGEEFKVLRDGGGTATAAWLAGLRELPAIEYNATAESSNYNFRAQHNNVAKITSYTKFLGSLNKPKDCRERREAVNIYNLAEAAKLNLDFQDTNHVMTVDAFSLFKRSIKKFGGDERGTTWGNFQAPRLLEAVKAIESAHVFPWDTSLTIPGSFLEAFTCFVHVSDLKLPRDANDRQEYLATFLKELASKYKLSRTMKGMGVNSSNEYGWQGAIALMKEWSKIMPNKNRGRGKKRYHKFDATDYTMVEASKGTRRLT